MKKQPIVLSSEKDGKIVYIQFTDGKKYKIQHPGTRTWMEWTQEMFSLEDGIDNIGFMETAFEHCVFPVEHKFKPTIDDVKPQELEAWQKFLRRFLRGDVTVPAQAKEGRTESTDETSKPPKKGS